MIKLLLNNNNKITIIGLFIFVTIKLHKDNNFFSFTKIKQKKYKNYKKKSAYLEKASKSTSFRA